MGAASSPRDSDENDDADADTAASISVERHACVCADGVDYGVQPANHTALVPPTRAHTQTLHTCSNLVGGERVYVCAYVRECTYYKPHCNRAALAPLACRSPPTPTPTNSPAIYSSHPAAQSSIQPAIVPFMPFLERQPANQPTRRLRGKWHVACLRLVARRRTHLLLPSCPPALETLLGGVCSLAAVYRTRHSKAFVESVPSLIALLVWVFGPIVR